MQTQRDSSSAASPYPRYRWVIMAASFLAHADVVMGGFPLVPLAPFLQGDLISTRTELGAMVSVLLLGAAIGSTPGGWLADRSIRLAFLSSQVLLGAMFLLISRIPSFQASLLPLFLAGLGFGAMIPAMTKATAHWFPSRERALALGIVMAAAPLGNAITAFFLPSLGLAWGWRYALLPVVGLVLCGGLVSTLLYRPPPAPPPQPSSVRPERTVRPWDILRRWETWLLGLVAILLGAAEHSFRTYFLLYLKEVILLPVVLAGWYLAIGHGSGLFGRIGWGLMSDRLGRRREALALEAFLAAAIFFLLGTAWGSPWSLPILALAFGLTGGGWVTVWTAMLVESTSSHSVGREMGMAMVFAYGGVILGPILFGRSVDLAGGSYGTTWMLVAGTTALAGGLALLLREKAPSIG